MCVNLSALFLIWISLVPASSLAAENCADCGEGKRQADVSPTLDKALLRAISAADASSKEDFLRKLAKEDPKSGGKPIAFLTKPVRETCGAGFGNNHRFKIYSKTGRAVEDLSVNPNEEEVLFKNGTRFKVLDRVQQEAGTVFRVLSLQFR